MKSLGVFTEDEIREKLGYKPLTNEQRKSLVVDNKEIKSNHGGELGASSDGNVRYPTTEHSSFTQETDGAQSKVNDALGYES